MNNFSAIPCEKQSGYFISNTTKARVLADQHGFSVHNIRNATGSSSNPNDFANALNSTFGPNANQSHDDVTYEFFGQGYEPSGNISGFPYQQRNNKDLRPSMESKTEESSIDVIGKKAEQANILPMNEKATTTSSPLELESKKNFVKDILNATTADEEIALLENYMLLLKNKIFF